MKKFDIIFFAFGNFFRRKARSALTVLGVVIGTAAVIIMLSIGIGMDKGFEAQFSQWGNLREIMVYKHYTWEGDETQTDNAVIGYMDDQGFLEIKSLSHIKAATPKMYSSYPILNTTEKQSAQVQFTGISATDMQDFDYKILSGRLLDETDVGTNNFVMAFNVPFYFGPYKLPVYWMEIAEGQELPFNPVDVSYKFTWDYSYGQGPVNFEKPKPKLYDGTCVGIIAQREGGDWDTSIYMDIKGLITLQEQLMKDQEKQNIGENGGEDGGVIYYTNEKMINDGSGDGSGRKDPYGEFLILVDDMDNVQDVEKEIRKLGYDTNSSMEYLTQMKDQTAFLRNILGAIGIVAFLVAALSITNTMIMSIYERTREIGIMKVMGCRLSDVRSMFLLEAGIIGLIGGIIGVGVSYIAAYIINDLAMGKGGLLGITDVTTDISVIPPWLNGLALLLAIAVGIISGLYPAIRATRLSALEAIKNE